MSNYVTSKEQNFEWKKVSYSKKFYKGDVQTVLIRFSGGEPMGIRFSRDITDAAGWEGGTRCTLYRSGGMFKLAKETVGLETVRQESGLCFINSKGLATQIYAFSSGEREFEAWVDGEDIIFMKKRV